MNNQNISKKYSQLIKEKADTCGFNTLNNVELLSMLLGMQFEKSLCAFENKSIWDIRNEVDDLNLNPVQKRKLNLLFEFSNRASKAYPKNRPIIKSPDDGSRLVMEEMRYLDHEVFRIIMLNTKNVVLGIQDISKGSLSASIVHPREVMKAAIRKSCASIILVHNHPSGDPDPSSEDTATTERICEAGKIIGIQVLDHLIIGDGRFVSFKERGLL